MVNYDRIVPITKIDFLSLIGTVLNLQSVEFSVAESTDVEGDFELTEAGTYLANQPIKSLDFAEGVASATVYFVADYAYTGFTAAGAAATIAEGSAEVNPDGCDLYKAVLASGSVTITAITPSVAR